LNATTGAITGTPTAAAASTFTITASDSQTLTISKSFTITVRSGLVLTAALPDGVLQTLYRFVFVSGGTPGYAISVASGSLPDGLGFDLAAGSITGTPTRSGAFRFTLQVSDGSQPSLTASRDYTLTIALPTLPAVTLTPLLDSTPSASQPSFGVSMGSGYPVDLTGTAAISFKPISGPVDPDIKFANGQTTASFTVPAGQTTALSGVTPMAFSAGTTAGTITLTVVLSANGTPVLPNPALTKAIVVPPAAPSISSVRMVTTPNGINVLVSGYSNTREIAGATLTFTAGSGASLTTGAFTVPVQAFQDWYASSNSAAFGGQFLLTVPFKLTAGSASLLTAVEVSLTNSIGRTTVSGGF
jgi:hypothetical protein